MNTFVGSRRGWALAGPGVLAGLALAALLGGLSGAAWAGGSTHFVDGAGGADSGDCTNSSSPCATVAYALTQSTDGHTIRVAEGVYTETLEVASAVSLLGGYEAAGWTRDIAAHPTVLDGTGGSDPVIYINAPALVLVEGFTIQNGNAAGEGGGLSISDTPVVISATVVQSNTAGNYGGGVRTNASVLVGARPQGEEGEFGPETRIYNSVIRGNLAGSGGGGVSAVTPLYIENSLIEHNVAGEWGGGLRADGPLTMTASRVLTNTGTERGGGLSVRFATISGSLISGNVVTAEHGSIAGGGLDLGPGKPGETWLFMEDTVISHNAAETTDDAETIAGGLNLGNGLIIINRSVVFSNVAQYNTGVSVFGAVLTMTNSLIAQNTGHGLGGPFTGTVRHTTLADNLAAGLWVNTVEISAEVEVVNAILWGNGQDVACDPTAACDVSYSLTGTGVVSGTGNLNLDPLFVGGGDYRLQLHSPAINAGTPLGAPLDDLDGNPRDDGLPDLGAFEMTVWRLFLPLISK